jgi:hypothetical protein
VCIYPDPTIQIFVPAIADIPGIKPIISTIREQSTNSNNKHLQSPISRNAVDMQSNCKKKRKKEKNT